MLYGNTTISTYTRSNVAVWMAMAFQAGLLNIGGFMACHRFVSHVTGFATYFGLEINQTNNETAFGIIAVPLFFLFGAMLSGQLVDLRIKQHKKPKYYITFGIIFFLTLTVLFGGVMGYFGIFGEPLSLFRDYVLLALLCLICGIQNATITTVSKSVIRTTHLTGITTDLGIGIVRFLHRDHLSDHSVDESNANLMRMGIIAFFIFGSVLGGYAFSHLGYGGFIVPVITTGSLFVLMLYHQVYRARSKGSIMAGNG